jgi:hypothetical protein
MRNLSAAVLLAGLTACMEPNLGEYETDEIEATLKLQNMDAGDGAAFEVILLASGTYIKLTEDAALTATWDGESVELEQVGQGALITYGADVSMPDAAEVNIEFTRPDGEDALDNPISMGASFEIDSVSGSVAPGGSLDIATSGGSGSVALTISGDCIQQYDDSLSLGDGGGSVPFESLVPVDSENPTSCALTTQLHDEFEGEADAGWMLGSITVGRVLRRSDDATTYQP